MSDKAKYGYLAGIIDGEGHIRIQRNVIEGRKKDGSDCVSFICSIGVRNTDLRLMRWLIQHFGGVYYPNAPVNNKPHWKRSYNWHLFGKNNLQDLLLAVMPYLQLKKEQATIALEFLRLENHRSPEQRYKLWQRIAKLNARPKPTATVETNTPDTSPNEVKRESVLIGNNECMPAVTQSI